ncbi:transcriptional regulator family: Fungal Specific TF [Paecilomyces variotii]|nr:transcriptional regulator family: Fungal Specific TF [Paecilomyces variotii]
MSRFAEHWRQFMQSSSSGSQNIYSLESSGYVPAVLFHPQLLSGCMPSSFNQVPRDPIDTKLFWKTHLAAALPSQNQCDLLMCYYMENSNWLYQAIHVPSFRHQYSQFWTTNVDDIDLIWLSLLFTIISISALHIPFELVEAIGFEPSKIRSLAHTWHSASRQALHAGEFESKPNLMQLQTFIATQLYWLSTKNIEAMNSALGQAVRNAQALGLDKGTPGVNCLDTELRRRAWWDLWCCDTFQSLCLDRTPLIHTAASKVPLPLNCNDHDITETAVKPRPMEEPTDMSATICRAEAFKILRKIYVSDGDYVSSYDYIRAIDGEIQQLVDCFPFYFRTNSEASTRHLSSLDHIAWQHCVLHISICMQRIRMNRQFLHARIGESWAICARAAQRMLDVYRSMREPDVERFRRSQKYLAQGYQIYTAAITLAAFLLVERSFPDFSPDLMRKDIEMVISDLELKDIGSIVADGLRVLRKMLDMIDQRESRDPQARESLVREIAIVFGGEQPTRKYLKRCDIGYVLNASQRTDEHISAQARSGTLQEHDDLQTTRGDVVGLESDLSESQYQNQSVSQEFDLALDMLDSGQFDFLLADMIIPS